MTPRTALAEVYGAIQADDILAKLKKTGWIVVKADAIKLAHAHARDEARADMRESVYIDDIRKAA